MHYGKPTEGIWSVLKGGVLANLAVASFAHLVQVIRHGLKKIQYRPGLIEGCLAGTGLTLDQAEQPNRHHELKTFITAPSSYARSSHDLQDLLRPSPGQASSVCTPGREGPFRGRDVQNQLIWLHTRPSPVQFPRAPSRRYTGDLVKRMMHSAGHDAGSPKSSSPSLAPRRNTNRRRSAQRVPVL